VGTWLIRSFLRRLVDRTPTEFDDALLEAVGPQLRWLVVIFCFHFATARLSFPSPDLRRFLSDVFFVLGLMVGLSMGWKLITLAFTSYGENLASDEDRDRLDPVLTLLRRSALIVWVIIGAIFLLGHFGLNVTAVAAALGIAGLALSLAAQDTIADAISGFVILMDQPFRVGDRIEISELGTWGDVVEIGSRTTRIRTRDNRLVIVPNSTIGKNQVVNYTYPDPQYRVQIDIGIGYGNDIEKTRQLIVDTVRGLEGVLPDKPVDALYNEMGASAMMFRVRWWIESYADTRRIFDRVNTALQVALDEAGIEMPFPTQTVNLQVDQETAKRIVQTIQQPDMAE
jgi:small-conductance mechanosensitive channel